VFVPAVVVGAVDAPVNAGVFRFAQTVASTLPSAFKIEIVLLF
jgi:hypothetical protein